MDTADLYGAHRYLRTALDGVSRDDYMYMSKMWPRTEYWNTWSGGATEEVDRFRKELNSDLIVKERISGQASWRIVLSAGGATRGLVAGWFRSRAV